MGVEERLHIVLISALVGGECQTDAPPAVTGKHRIGDRVVLRVGLDMVTGTNILATLGTRIPVVNPVYLGLFNVF
jgi:hypothetical protein